MRKLLFVGFIMLIILVRSFDFQDLYYSVVICLSEVIELENQLEVFYYLALFVVILECFSCSFFYLCFSIKVIMKRVWNYGGL